MAIQTYGSHKHVHGPHNNAHSFPFHWQNRRHGRIAQKFHPRQDEPPPPADTSSSTTESSTVSSSTVSSSISSSSSSSSFSQSSSSSLSQSSSSSRSSSSSVSRPTTKPRPTSRSTTTTPTGSPTRRSSRTDPPYSPPTTSSVTQPPSTTLATTSSTQPTSQKPTQSDTVTSPPVVTSTITLGPSATPIDNTSTRNNGFSTNTGGIIGVAVGSGFFLVLISVLLFFLCRRYRRRAPTVPPETAQIRGQQTQAITLDDDSDYNGPYSGILAAMRTSGSPDEPSDPGDSADLSSNGHSSSSHQGSRSQHSGSIEGTLFQHGVSAGWYNRSTSPAPQTSLGGMSSYGHSSSSHGGYGSSASRRPILAAGGSSSQNTTPSSGEEAAPPANISYFGPPPPPPSAFRSASTTASPPHRTLTIKLPPDPRSATTLPQVTDAPASPTSVYSSRPPSSLLNPAPAIMMNVPHSRPVSIALPHGYEFGSFGQSTVLPPMIDPSPALTDPGDYIPEGLLHPSLSTAAASSSHPSAALKTRWNEDELPHTEGDSPEIEQNLKDLSPPPRRPGFGMTGVEGSKRSFQDELDYSRPIGVNRGWMGSTSDVNERTAESIEETDEDDNHDNTLPDDRNTTLHGHSPPVVD